MCSRVFTESLWVHMYKSVWHGLCYPPTPYQTYIYIYISQQEGLLISFSSLWNTIKVQSKFLQIAEWVRIVFWKGSTVCSPCTNFRFTAHWQAQICMRMWPWQLVIIHHEHATVASSGLPKHGFALGWKIPPSCWGAAQQQSRNMLHQTSSLYKWHTVLQNSLKVHNPLDMQSLPVATDRGLASGLASLVAAECSHIQIIYCHMPVELWVKVWTEIY